MASSTLVATTIVCVPPIFDLDWVDRQEEEWREPSATEGAIEGLQVYRRIWIVGQAFTVLDDTFVALFVFFIDEVGLVAADGIALGVDYLTKQMAFPNLEEFIVGGSRVELSKSSHAHLLGGLPESEDFDGRLCHIVVVLTMSLFGGATLHGVGLCAGRHEPGEGLRACRRGYLGELLDVTDRLSGGVLFDFIGVHSLSRRHDVEATRGKSGGNKC